MQFSIADIRKYIYENHGYEPNKEDAECLIYYLEKRNIKIELLKYWTDDEFDGQQFISFSEESKDRHCGSSHPCDTFEELNENLEIYMDKKDVQLGLF